MPAHGTPAWHRFTMLAIAGGVAVLARLAAVADENSVGGTLAYTALDLTVAFAFVVGSLAATGTLNERLLMGAVGPAWLAGSVFASGRSLHQAVLALALLAFPSGRLSGVPRQSLGLGAVVVAFEVVPQVGVAALFATVTLVTLWATGRSSTAFPYPAASSTGIAAALVFAWWAVRHSSAVSPLVLYDAVLITVATGFPFATRAVSRSGARLTDRVLGDVRFAGLPGLRLVLDGVLDDPSLDIVLWDANAGCYVGSVGHDSRAASSPAGLTVLEGDEVLARVLTTSPALADGATSEAVAAAVRLAVVNHRLRQQQTRQLADLEASRKRLLAAADNERERVATRLRSGAGARLEQAHSKLAAAAHTDAPQLAALAEFASSQVATAATDVQRIIAGAPPQPLGEGRLPGAITLLAALSAAHVTLQVTGDVAADADAETTLFYVCSEALANASKHSGATRVVIELQRLGTETSLSVRDNGRGGANAAGSGLQGLADRLAAAGGRLTVDSPPDGGTAVVASVPLRRD